MKTLTACLLLCVHAHAGQLVTVTGQDLEAFTFDIAYVSWTQTAAYANMDFQMALSDTGDAAG